MTGHDYIFAKQLAWAKSKDLHLVSGSGRVDLGARTYVADISDNLFEPLSKEALVSFVAGDGNELGTANRPGKMQALHSSSALGVNVFGYWQARNDAASIASACGLCRQGSNAPESIVFEKKYPIDSAFDRAPNIDIVITNREGSFIKAFGIECKFSEAYGSYKHSGLSPKYLIKCKNVWKQLPNLYRLAQIISPDDQEFKFLHPAQLIKHSLGLMEAYGKKGFRLMYLWYDVPGKQGASHRTEVERFSEIVKADGILFHSMTYQELIVRMMKALPGEHNEYVKYLAGRYL